MSRTLLSAKRHWSFQTQRHSTSLVRLPGPHAPAGLIRSFAGSLFTGGADTTVSSSRSLPLKRRNTLISASSTASTILLAAVAFPDKLKVVQDELDRVIGPDRAPLFVDKEDLPELQGEILSSQLCRKLPDVYPLSFCSRSSSLASCHSVRPMSFHVLCSTLTSIAALSSALPHSVTETFTYDGYVLPKGAIIAGNIWSAWHPSQSPHRV